VIFGEVERLALEQAQQGPLARQLADRAIAQQDRALVPGASVGQPPGGGVDHAVEHGHEHIRLAQLHQEAVDRLEHGARRGGPAGFGQQQAARQGHVQRRRHPFVRHVRDGDAETVRVQGEHVVEVAADLPRRIAARGEPEARHLGERARQHALLDLPGQLELALHALFVGQLGLSRFQLRDLGAQVGDQPGPLDRQCRLVRERLQQRDLARLEPVSARGVDDHQAGLPFVGHQRDGQPGAQHRALDVRRAGRDARRPAVERLRSQIARRSEHRLSVQLQAQQVRLPAADGQHARAAVRLAVVEEGAIRAA